jgi:pimeloyl-ACP methyl ester carboxylesterase
VDLSVPVSDAAALHVRYWRGSADPPFLLLHGLDANARIWDLVARRLAAAGHAVYAIDQRGHGESAPAGSDYDNATAAADTAAVAAAVGVTDAVVAGHSWGALLALRLTAEHPGLVAGIALIEGGWAHASVVHESWDLFASMLAKPKCLAKGTTLDVLRSYHRAVFPGWPEASTEAALSSLRVTEEGLLSHRLPPEQREAIMRSVWDDPPAQWFPAVKVPVVLMRAVPKPGGRYKLRGPWEPAIARINAFFEPAAAALPGAMVREYPDGDHDLHAQFPDRVAADLLDLVDEVRRRTASQ